VLIKVKAVALCTWEQRFYKGIAAESYPFRGGHEVSGEVVALGSGAVCEACVGDRVAVSIMTRCGVCDTCRRGLDNFCENDDGGAQPGLPWGPGGLSDYVILEDYQVYKALPESSFLSLSLAEPVACVLRSVRLAGLLYGDTALVQGAGIMGLIHVMLLKQSGVTVLVSEPDQTRREKALEIGADFAANPLDDGFADWIQSHTSKRGVNAVYFTAGGGPAVTQALPLLARGGWLCLYGSVHPKGTIEIDPNFIHYNELNLTGTFSHTKHSFRQSVALLSGGLVDASPFISEVYPFTEVEAAFERAISPETYRVLVSFD
jgi:L-iditol 2-dehydrogenase